jgi:hypothetical protein
LEEQYNWHKKMLIAQSQINIQPGGQFSNLTNFSFPNLVSLAISFVLIITAIILFFVIIIGGIAVIVSGGSGGNSQAAQRGQNAITGAIIGLVIIFGAWAILGILQNFFGVNLLQLNLP